VNADILLRAAGKAAIEAADNKPTYLLAGDGVVGVLVPVGFWRDLLQEDSDLRGMADDTYYAFYSRLTMPRFGEPLPAGTRLPLELFELFDRSE
jgi:hypothetical protein